MLEDTLVGPELSSSGQFLVPGEAQHVAGGPPGQLRLLSPSHSPPEVVVERQDLLLHLAAHTALQDLPTAIRGSGLAVKYFLRKSQYPIYLQVGFCQTWIDLCHISYQHSVGKVSHSISTLETKNACKINQHYWKISYSYFTLNIANSNYPESSEW